MPTAHYFVCGFNGFHQFTKFLGKVDSLESESSQKQTTSYILQCADARDNLCLTKPTEFCWFPKSLLFSWSSVIAYDSDSHNYKTFGCTKRSSNYLKLGQFVCSLKEGIQSLESGVNLEFPDCPRGFDSCCLTQAECSSLNDIFYVVSVNGVFKAEKITKKDASSLRDKLYSLSKFVIPSETSSVTSLSCGKEHVLLLTSAGRVYSFGAGSRGQLGIDSLENRNVEAVIDALQPLCVVMIAAGGWHSLALTNTGDVYSWGWNQSGQLGIGCLPEIDYDGGSHRTKELKTCTTNKLCERLMFSTLPVLVDLEKDVEKIGCGTRHTAAMLIDKTLWTWGWNGYGQLGLGDQNDRHYPTMVEDFCDSPVTDFVCNAWNTLVCTQTV